MGMSEFSSEVLEAAAREREVTLTTYGRTSGEPRRVVIWVSGDGRRLFIRSGRGPGRHWTRNILADDRAVLHVGDIDVPVRARRISDPEQARAVTELVARKYGDGVQRSPDAAHLTPAEQATFELVPVDR
jgi:deazaflavin-dependent oxidoreductase (nitroreductase family)